MATHTLDTLGLKCPQPILKVAANIEIVAAGTPAGPLNKRLGANRFNNTKENNSVATPKGSKDNSAPGTTPVGSEAAILVHAPKESILTPGQVKGNTGFVPEIA